jgi:hypothetical protein
VRKIKPIIENRYGKPITFSSECIDVAKHILNTTGLNISAQTLRRMLGFIDSKVMPSKNSLEIIALYCGFNSFKDLNQSQKKQINISKNDNITIIKSFYNIDLHAAYDFNYQNACGNIAELILNDRPLLNQVSSFLSKNKIAQIFFFERFPYIDGLCNGYETSLKKYYQEKKTTEAQLFSLCLLHLGAVLSLNKQKAKKYLHAINTIPVTKDVHSFVIARKLMANLLNAYNDKNDLLLESLIYDAFTTEENIQKTKKDYFPFFAFVMTDAFHLIERPLEAEKMLRICNAYQAPTNSNVNEMPIDLGYIKGIELMNGLSAYHLGDHKKAKRILNSIEVQNIPFIFRNYFLIQVKRIEYKLCVKASSKKKTSIYNEIETLIIKTGFVFFKDHKTI